MRRSTRRAAPTPCRRGAFRQLQVHGRLTPWNYLVIKAAIITMAILLAVEMLRQ